MSARSRKAHKPGTQADRRRLFPILGALIILALMMPVPARASLSGARTPAVRLDQAADGAGETAIEVTADTYGLPLADDEIARQYAAPSVFLESGDQVRFDVSVDVSGPYTIWLDMAAPESFINPPQGRLLIDGVLPSDDTAAIVFPVFYQNTAGEFPLDRYGNQALIRQERLVLWTKVPVRDANLSLEYPIQFGLAAGEHSFEFQVTEETMLLGSIYLESFAPLPDYAAYQESHAAPDSSGVSIVLEAEFPAYKNNTSIRPVNSLSLEVTPYDTYSLLLNTLGGEKWHLSGSAVFYEFEVPEDGMYEITLSALQNTKDNFTVFRRITIDGQVPFAELNAVPFDYSTRWENVTLGAEDPFKIHLAAGTHVLGIEASSSPYYAAIEKIKKVLLDINALSLEIKKLTGNQVDPFKEWVISDYIPDLEDQLIAIANDLEADLEGLQAINRSGGSQEIQRYQMAIDNVLFLTEDPDEIPTRLNRFSEGPSSAAQLLGNLLPALQSQPLTLDRITIHSPDAAPEPARVSVFTAMWEGFKRFIDSFRQDPYLTIGAEAGEIEVWANRPRQYVDLMQLMADQDFTPETGIRVKFSIMPDESKLVLANAAAIQPDVALGVSAHVPYELAIRNALMDLRSFEDFDSFIRVYSPGALLSYVINDSAYALPETQDFWVTFYREDILSSLGIPVPHTWDEVIAILPELQRYGLNFNTPLSSGTGFKNYLLTAPFLFNFDAPLYSDGGFATGMQTDEAIEAVKFMAECFTIYGMPLTTSSFYDSFRYGSLPIGISNFVDTYLKLITAAPELNGLWAMELYPATVLDDGRELRYATGTAQAGIMFANTDMPAESWEFMKWWMSTGTQVDFQQQMILNYGLEYLWNSANVDAFAFSPIPQEHKDVILAQWEWLQEPVKLPGSYMQEREVSNAWNRIVFDGVNPRVAIDSTIITINREITRKMEEFGYLENGVRVKEFTIPTIETIEGWMENGD